MRRLAAILFVTALCVPAMAQWQRWNLSSDDQQRFDSYYSRRQEYRQRTDREQTTSMEKRMLDVYAHYNIPAQTPYWRVASNARIPTLNAYDMLSERFSERSMIGLP